MFEQRYKVVTHVPVEAADAVRQAAGDAGGGVQGAYSHCSFTMRGTGRFLPTEEANPSIGEVGKLETVEEELIEFVCDESVVKITIDAIKAAHPYEEVPIEVYKLERF